MCKFGVSAPWYENDQTAFNLYAMECEDETPDDDDADCFCDDWDEDVIDEFLQDIYDVDDPFI